MKQNYKVLNTKNCEGIKFRIIYDSNSSWWQYKIQYQFNIKMKRYKKIWVYRNHQSALDDFECDIMLKSILQMVNK